MKRIAVLGLGLAMLLSLVGCANTPAPTPSPLATPVITPEETTTPIVGEQGNGGAQTPDTSSGATPGQDLSIIPGFSEGATVESADIPDIMDAFKNKYRDYEVVGVTQATLDNHQLYLVEYKDNAGETGKVYLRSDASWYEPVGLTNTP